MTSEERMIRVTKEVWNETRQINEAEYDVDLGSWEELEPAPPKDFEPKCKRIGELTGSCSPDECLTWDDCPYRKRA